MLPNCCSCSSADGTSSAPSSGPGYKSPLAAFTDGLRERVLFVTCPNVDPTGPDMLATVCVQPDSANYCKIVGQLELPYAGDEVHHSGWNACSSCHDQPGKCRSHLVLPCLNSSRIYTINVTRPEKPTLEKIVEPEQLAAFNVSFPHTAHCLADGNVMVSTLGNEWGEAKGNFLLLDGGTFQPLRTWPANGKTTVPFNYDYWYQPRRGLMLSTEWGQPTEIKQGFAADDVQKGFYGHSIHVWDWQNRELLQTIELEGPEGQLPLEVRFLHEPTRGHAFVGTALGSAIYHFWREEERPGPMQHQLAASIPPKRVQGWPGGEWMPALVTDILLSMDDRFLYLSCWLHGDIRQWDITDPGNPKMVGQCFVGGSIHRQSGVTVLEDKELKCQPEQLLVQGRPVPGGPQMLQLSLDGRRLYVTNSLYSVWDAQFYPEVLKHGSTMLQLDVDIDKGGLTVNQKFRVDFDRSKQLPNGPYLAHEMRYPGGDCTSDIWL